RAAEAAHAFVHLPAEVAAGLLAGPEDGHLLDRILADVPDPHVAGAAIERPPPRIAHAVDVDLAGAAACGERIVGGDAVLLVRRLVVDVDAQDLAEER